MAKSESIGPKKDNFTKILVIVVIVGVLAIMVLPKLFEKKGSASAAIPAAVSSTDGYGIVFNSDLKSVPTIDIYEDFQCPVCQQFEALNGAYVQSLITEKKAKVVYHILSFIGGESVLAANAAACAADQDKYLAYHDALYANQGQENTGNWNNATLLTYGAGVGITSQKFTSCVTKGSYSGWVQKSAEAGQTAKVNSTPTIFVNGKEIDRKTEYFNAALFKAAIARG